MSSATLAVILVAAHSGKSLRATLGALVQQTVASQLEVIVVGPSQESIAELPIPAAFARTVGCPTGPIHEVDKAAARGLALTTAPIVAFLEDHVLPDCRWAERILEAHAGPWAVVGSAYRNANPESTWSWANLLLAYGRWVEPVRAGPGPVSRHNLTFKTAILKTYGPALEGLLGRSGRLLEQLRGDGHSSYLCARAIVAHVNPSLFGSTVYLRFHGGRLAAASRSRDWSWRLRLLYALASPLIPLVRGARLFTTISRLREPRLWAGVATALLLDGAGQGWGFALGPGQSESLLAAFERQRLPHLRASERHLLE